MNTEKNTSMPAGFYDPVMDSQRTFRVILEAMSRPGKVLSLPVLPEAPAPLYTSTTAICLTLFDLDTPVWLDEAARASQVAEHLRFHCGCPIIEERDGAAFGLIAAGDCVPPLDSFVLGDPLYPERSATIIIQVASLDNTGGMRLTGPGIETEANVNAAGLCGSFWPEFRANRALFPQGVDVLLVSPFAVCGLPRTVVIED
jgi:alpha-D-ribose 1-methylphosphonate 5-triphosphate synthase subunit PhnH